MKKLFAVLALSTTLLAGCSGLVNSNPGLEEGAVDGLRNVASCEFVRGAQVGADSTLSYSRTYVQYGKNDEGQYVIRFATAVKGDISSLSYTRAAVAGLEARTAPVTTVYRGIEAESNVYYYDGSDITTDESHAGNYYWACYSIAFATKAHYETAFDVTLSVDGVDVASKSSALTTICTDCEVVGHNWVREGELKATSVTKGALHKVCGNCGHEEVTELDYNAENSGVLAPSDIDAEVSNLDLVRGMTGDFTLTFKWTAQMTAESNWNSARICLLNLDEGKWTPGVHDNTNVYGKALACPENAGTYNGCQYVGYSKNAAGAWYSKDPFKAYAKDMTAEAKLVRSGDFVHVYVNSTSNIDTTLSNKNEWHFYIPAEKTMNVVLGVTGANLTLLESSLKLDGTAVAKSTEELVTTPISVNAEGKGYTYEHVVHQVALEGEIAKATYKFNVNRTTNGDNTWGHWRATAWRTDLKHDDGTEKTPHPWGEIDPHTGEQYQYNGSLLARLTPLDQDTHDWNGNMAFVKNTYTWFASPVDGSGGFNYAELMKDADVTLTIYKFGSYVMMRAYIVTNLEYDSANGLDCKGAFSTTEMSFRVPEETRDRIAFSVDTEQTNLTVKSCVVEKF